MTVPRKGVVVCREKSCGTQFIYLNVHKLAGGITRMPVNIAEDANGNIAVTSDWSTGRMLGKGGTPQPGETRHVSHFVDCTQPKRFRGKEKQPAVPKPEPAPKPMTLFDDT